MEDFQSRFFFLLRSAKFNSKQNRKNFFLARQNIWITNPQSQIPAEYLNKWQVGASPFINSTLVLSYLVDCC